MNEICQPVETKFGIINGRDSLILDYFDFDCDENTLMLSGSLSLTNRFMEHISAQLDAEQILYAVTFRGVMAFSVLELDSWSKLNRDRDSQSCFDEITNSVWQMQMISNGKITAQHRHFTFSTYDDVIDVICHDFKMNFRKTL